MQPEWQVYIRQRRTLSPAPIFLRTPAMLPTDPSGHECATCSTRCTCSAAKEAQSMSLQQMRPRICQQRPRIRQNKDMDHAQYQVADQDVRLRPHTKPPVLRHCKRQRAFHIQMPAATQARPHKLPCFFRKKNKGNHITDSICTTVH